MMDFINAQILPITVAAPAIAALLLLPIPDRKLGLIRAVSAAGAIVSFLGALHVVWHYDLAVGGLQFATSFDFVPSLGISLSFAADGWGVSLFLLTGLIIVTGVFASFSVEDRAKDFFILLLLLVAGVYGVFVIQDLFVFFLFYEIAVLPMYLLIGIWGSSNKVADAGPFKVVWKLFDVGGKEYAAMKLTLMLLIGSLLILLTMLAMFHEAGSSSFAFAHLEAQDFSRPLQIGGFLALWFGFGTLAGLWPFHTWSPDGHAAAPTAVSMLHAGVLMKLGAFGLIRIGMMMLPDGAQELAWLVGLVAAVNICWGALSAMAQKDLKYIIAYSSVSHMGVVLLGAATMTVSGWNGAVYQMFAHGLMTGLFFALVGHIYGNAHTRLIPKMGGFGSVMPAIAIFFTIGCLSSLGMPGLAGFVAEFLVFLGAWGSAAPWWAIAGILGAWMTAIYVLRAARQIFWGEGPGGHFTDLRDPRGIEWVAFIVLAGALIVFGLWPRLVLDPIDVATAQYLPELLGTTLEALK
jgi:NADH-quinone oxidoreductase subunit M